MPSDSKQRLFWAILVLLFWVPLSILLFLAARKFVLRQAPEGDLAYRLQTLPEEQKAELYRTLARQADGSYDITGEPGSGRLLQPGRDDLNLRQASVVSNRAGLRSRREYRPKPADKFRIVCLGDSFTFGTGGPEEDRYADQMEQILSELGATGNGKEIEVLAVGVGSWNTVNEVTYMTSRLTAYDADVIIALMVTNDLDDTLAVTGLGISTKAFTPERDFGSSTFFDTRPFGTKHRSGLLHTGLGPFSGERWRRAFALWKRLEELQLERGGEFLLSVLNPAREGGKIAKQLSNFLPVAAVHHRRAGLATPLLVVDYFRSSKTRLAHDAHPNRRGHRIIAAHYLHSLAARDIIEVDRQRLPPLHPGLSLDSAPVPAEQELRTRAAELARDLLPTAIDFDRLKPRDLNAVLGGLLPASRAEGRLPFAGPRLVFLLRREPEAEAVHLAIRVPARPELFPFDLALTLDGREADGVELASVDQAGEKTLSAALPDPAGPVVELSLETASYWAEIADATTRSYRVVRVWQE